MADNLTVENCTWEVEPDWKARAEAAEANLARAREIMKPFAHVAMRFLAHELPLDTRGVELTIPLGASEQGRTGADLIIGCNEQLHVSDFRAASRFLTEGAAPLPPEQGDGNG